MTDKPGNPSNSQRPRPPSIQEILAVHKKSAPKNDDDDFTPLSPDEVAALEREAEDGRRENLQRLEAVREEIRTKVTGDVKKIEEETRQAAASVRGDKKNNSAKKGGAQEKPSEEDGGEGGGLSVNKGDGKASKEEEGDALHLVAEQKTMTYEQVMAEVDGMIGMDDFKDWIHALDGGQAFDEVADALGMIDHSKEGNKEPLHITLLGNPGTGKSMAAELYCYYLKASGKMRDALFYKVTAGDLVSPYVGATARAIKDLLKKGKDKEMVDSVTGEKYVGQRLIIHLDEAYALTTDDHGKQALNELVAVMTEEPHRIVLVLSGYPLPMGKMLSENPGMRSRVRKNVECKDYTDPELLKILKTKLPKEKVSWILPPEVDQELEKAFLAVRGVMGKHFGNGRVSEYLLANSLSAAKARMSAELKASGMTKAKVAALSAEERKALEDKMRTVTVADVQRGLKQYLTQPQEADNELDAQSSDPAAAGIISRLAEELGQLQNLVMLQQSYLDRLARGEDPLAAPKGSSAFETPAVTEAALAATARENFARAGANENENGEAAAQAAAAPARRSARAPSPK